MTKVHGPADFWAKADKTDGCWLWQGSLWTKGYGRAFYRGQTWRAHRLAYLLTHGPIPAGMFVCHRCDQRLCVRPDHLFLGSVKDNHRDAIQKGRNSHGEIHGSAKLTQADVLAIQQSRERSGVLAERYGVDRTTIGRARYGRSWRDV